MHEVVEEVGFMERCRRARREVERRYPTMAALCAHYRRLDKKRKRNIEAGLRFLKLNNKGR